MTTPHTPGPWQKKSSGGGFVGFTIEAEGKRVGTAYTVEDARLIAAAPQMLELLQNTMNRWNTEETSTDVMDDFVQEARALLTQVEKRG